MITVKIYIRVLILLGFVAISGLAEAQIPHRPDPQLTPGSLCIRPTRLRYPEQIKYCERDVSSETKGFVIELYEHKFNFRISPKARRNYKIDHYIPLCMGGSNEMDNLWPQHSSVYEITDWAEAEICGDLASGRIKQSEAIEKIKEIKNEVK